jgi:hydroxymethylglutaryl-CoA lyase
MPSAHRFAHFSGYVYSDGDPREDTVRDVIQVVEVSPRDGLQSEGRILDTATKVELIHRLIDAGVTRIEAASFVHPQKVPTMADAEDVIAGVEHRNGVSLAGLVLNERGFQRAADTSVEEINYVVVATETFSQRNQGSSLHEAIKVWERIGPRVADEGRLRSVTIGASFGCPFEGEVSVEHVAELARRIVEIGVDELALADTIGVADPCDVTRKLQAVAEVAPGVALRCHFHNTRNTGIANAYAAVQAGVTALDSSLGGIGGCPFAPNATGNIPTEDLGYMLARMGVNTGLDLGALLPSVDWISDQLGKPVPGLLAKAGLFPSDLGSVARSGDMNLAAK